MNKATQLNIWQELKRYFDENGRYYYAEPVPTAEITAAEQELQLCFADDYKKFIELYGGASVEAYSIHGLRYQDHMDGQRWSVVHRTKFYKEKQQWPDIADWYIISDDGRGNPIGMNPLGEVWLSDHDSNFEQVKLAENFAEFIHKLLNDTLYD